METRVEDLKELSKNVSVDGKFELFDKLRFMHGDNPANATELGNQKNGLIVGPFLNQNVKSSKFIPKSL